MQHSSSTYPAAGASPDFRAGDLHAGGSGADAQIKSRVMKKLNRHIVWYCFFLFIINYLDRVNIGFAALTMNQELGFDPKAFGLGASIFFLGYIFFEVPSNMILHKVGPRIWIARILVTWGIISCGMAAVQGQSSFYAMRFLLGVAEAGFAPGVLLYLSYWFPRKERGKAVAGFMLATVLSTVIGGPLSGALLSLSHGWMSLSGWQWMFVLEGLPAVVMGIVTFFYLVDRPEQDRKWLKPDERAWLVNVLDRERAEISDTGGHFSLAAVFKDVRVWLLTLIYLCNGIAIYGVVLWLPQIVKSVGQFTNAQTAFVATIPFVFAALGLVLLARSSDRTGERKFHTALSGLFGGLFLAASALVSSPLVSLMLLCCSAFFLWAILGVFWTLPAQFLTGMAAAGGLAAINGFAQFGGVIGPYLVGAVKQSTGSFSMALLALAAGPVLGFFLCMLLRTRRD
ncbi:MAG: MFS transporter [Gammaproteobacteria bacterium]|nr:MFS transporter [Gammaproteobacteria bacterium]